MELPNFLENLLEKAGFVSTEKARAPGVSASSSADPFTLWAQNKKVNPAKAMEVYTAWVYAAIRAIGMDIGNIDYKLFKIGRDADQELFEHELLDMLGAMNDYEVAFATKYVIAAHLEMVGNAYLFLEGVEKEGDKPIAIHTLIPSKVKVLARRDQFPPHVEGYSYRLGDNKWNFKPWQVIHIKYPDPSDPFEGVGTVQSLAQWIDADNYAMEFNRRFFLNGARIGGFLESESAYTPDQLQYLKESFESAFKGVENAYKVMALPKGTKYEEGGKTQKDMDFPNLSLMMRDRIIAGFRTPKTAIGITDDVNRANAEATDYVFASRTIRPIMRLITSYLNEFLVPRYGDNLYLGFEDPVPEDRKQRMGEMRTATGGHAVLTPNEARADYFGKDPIEGGDILPATTTPADPTAEPIMNSIKATATKKIKRARPVKTRYAQRYARRKEISEKMAVKATDAIQKILADALSVEKKGVRELGLLNEVEQEALYKGFALRVDGYEKKVREAVKEFNEEQRKEVVANLPEITKTFLGSTEKLRQADLFNLSGGISALIRIAMPIMTRLAEKEGAAAGALLAIADMDILTPEVTAAIDKAVELMSESYNRTTRDILKSKLEEGIRQGLSQPELAELIGQIYEHADEVRALTVARTETFRIANMATEAAWKQSGIVKTKIWYTAADERVCPYCGPMHGKVVSTETVYFEKGATITGSDGTQITADYDDISGGSLHPNCFVGDTKIISPDAKKMTRVKYSGNIIELSFADGTKVSVTPNHPILTARGFVAACLLKQGDKAIKAVLDKGVILSDPNDNNSPASISEVFDTLIKTQGVASVSVPVSAEDLHGDGKFGQGNIDIVYANGLLRDCLDTSVSEPIRKAFFNGTDPVGHGLPSNSSLSKTLLATAASADGIVSRDGIALILSGGAEAHHAAVRLQDGANYNARIQKSLADGHALDAERFGDAILGLPGAITTNDIIDIQVKPFHGFVYDVNSISTVYIANGIIASNCRCYIRPGEISLE